MRGDLAAHLDVELWATPPASAVKTRPSFSASGSPGRTSSATVRRPARSPRPARTRRAARAAPSGPPRVPALSCASTVDAPRCGVTTTWAARTAGCRCTAPWRTRRCRRRPTCPRLDRVGERVLVHQPAAGGVDDPHAGFDRGQLAGADEAERLRRLGQVDGDEVALARAARRGGPAGRRSARPGPAARTGRRRAAGRRTRTAAGRPARRSGRARRRRRSCRPARPR